jgi:Dihydrofolate reductase
MGGTVALRDFVVVVAATAGSLGIGKGGGIPWKLAGDMAYFKKVTSTCDVAGKVRGQHVGSQNLVFWCKLTVLFFKKQAQRQLQSINLLPSLKR